MEITRGSRRLAQNGAWQQHGAWPASERKWPFPSGGCSQNDAAASLYASLAEWSRIIQKRWRRRRHLLQEGSLRLLEGEWDWSAISAQGSDKRWGTSSNRVRARVRGLHLVVHLLGGVLKWNNNWLVSNHELSMCRRWMQSCSATLNHNQMQMLFSSAGTKAQKHTPGPPAFVRTPAIIKLQIYRFVSDPHRANIYIIILHLLSSNLWICGPMCNFAAHRSTCMDTDKLTQYIYICGDSWD